MQIRSTLIQNMQGELKGKLRHRFIPSGVQEMPDDFYSEKEIDVAASPEGENLESEDEAHHSPLDENPWDDDVQR